MVPDVAEGGRLTGSGDGEAQTHVYQRLNENTGLAELAVNGRARCVQETRIMEPHCV